MKKNLYIPLLLLVGASAAQAQIQNDTIWVGYSDQVTHKTEATYYKFIRPKKDNTFEVVKYTKKNILHSKGIAKNGESPSIYHGKVRFFDQKGQLLNTNEYVDGVLDGPAISTIIDGTTFTAQFKNDQLFEGTAIYEYEDVYTSLQAHDGELIKAELFAKTPNQNRQIVYFSNNTAIKEETYDAKGQLIASCTYRDYVIVDGKHIDFYYNPFQIKSISEHLNSELVKKTTYFRTGEVKETQVVSGTTNVYTYFDQTGKTIGVYNEQIDPEEYTTISDGTRVLYNTETGKEDLIESIYVYKDTDLSELHEFYDNGIIKQITQYRESYYPEKITNFDQKGNKESELIYDETGTPLNGTEKYDHQTRIYKDGKLITETQNYTNGALFKSVSDFKAVFFDKKGKKIGEAQFDPKQEYNYYSTPVHGVLLVINENDIITDSTTYKDGKTVNTTTFIEHNGKSVKIQEIIYDANEYKISETKYHINGKLLSQNNYANYELIESSFYDNKGNLLGKYDYRQSDGTLYTFFDSDNDIESISKYKKGELLYKKTYYKAGYSFYDVSKIYLESEIDFNKEGLFYEKGELISKAIYKNGKPFQGKTIIRDDYASKVETNYENGEKEGEEITYSAYLEELSSRDFFHLGQQIFTEKYENNVISFRIPMENGMYNGEAIYFDEEGQEAFRLIYKDNEPFEGKLTSSYGEDSKQITTYKNGLAIERRNEADGTTRYIKTLLNEENLLYRVQSFTENGTLRYDFTTVDDNIEGEVLLYNEKGKVQNKAIVKDGKLISGTISLTVQDNNYESPNHMLVTKKGEKYKTKVYSDEDDSLLYETSTNIISKKDGINPLPIILPITTAVLYPSIEEFEHYYY